MGKEKCVDFLEFFLRDLLLNERHPLLNGTMPISGALKKQDIEVSKQYIENGKQYIGHNNRLIFAYFVLYCIREGEFL